LFLSFLEFLANLIENGTNRHWINRAVSTYITGSWLRIYFNISYTCSILPSVVLLFHQKIQLVYCIQWSSVFFNIIRQGLSEPNHCYTAFVFYTVTHELMLILKLDISIDYYLEAQLDLKNKINRRKVIFIEIIFNNFPFAKVQYSSTVLIIFLVEVYSTIKEERITGL